MSHEARLRLRGVPRPILAVAALVLAAEPATASSPPELRLAELPAAAALPATPPLAAVGAQEVENESRLRVRSGQVVTVEMRDDGTPLAVRARQRLVVRGVGDFVFVVPAPVRDVSAAPGSDSRPGMRPGQILWQGFSPGRKLLAAVAELRPAAVEASLPLTVRTSTLVDGRPLTAGKRRTGRLDLRLTIDNQTVVTAQSFTAERVSTFDAAGALDSLREAVTLERPLPERPVRVAGTRPSTVLASAPLRISGSIRFDARALRGMRVSGATVSTRGGLSALRFRRVLGGGRPLSLSLAVHADAVRVRAPTLHLVAEPVLDAAALSPPARSWTEAVRERRSRLDGPALLNRAIVLGLRYGRARQFETFLATPDPLAPSRTTYVFKSAARVPVASVTRHDTGGSSVTLLVSIALAALVTIGLLVLWAHM